MSRPIEASATSQQDNAEAPTEDHNKDDSNSTASGQQQTFLATLLDVHQRIADPETPTAKAMMTETARIVVSICRTIKKAHFDPQGCLQSDSISYTALLERLYAEKQLANPLLLVIRNKLGVATVSEAWFGLALMAQHQEGATVVLKALEDESSFHLLEQVVRPADEQEVPRADRDNAVALIRLLLAHTVSRTMIRNSVKVEERALWLTLVSGRYHGSLLQRMFGAPRWRA